MKIAKIVSSNSHIDYIGRVIDDLDSDNPPNSDDYGFAQWVSFPMPDGDIVGIIYDSKLINPEYSNFGPRLSPKPALGNFTPDYLNEQGILLGILLLGSFDKDGKMRHEIPRRVVPAGQDIHKIEDAAVTKFHTDGDGAVCLHYYSQVIAHAGLFAVPLMEAIITQVSAGLPDTEQQRLAVLMQSLEWQRTFGAIRT
jgi:hypothetical protein